MMGCGRLLPMRSFRWIFVTVGVVVGLAIVAIAIGALWLNTFIHSPAFKTEVESRASQSLGGPVTIESIDFDVLHGIKLQGFNTQLDPSHSGGQGALKVQVARVNCTYSLGELLARKLRLTGITLDQPVIILTKQPTAPMSPSAPANASTPSGPASGASGDNSSSFQFVLDHAKVSDGAVTIHDATGATVVDLKGVNADANTSGYYDGKDVTGSFKVAQVNANNMQVTNFYTPFTYHTNALSASPFEAAAFAGKIAGGYQMDGSGPSVLDLNGKGLDVAQLTAATSSSSSAKLSGSLDLQSKWRGVETGDLDGEGDAQLTGGKLEGVKILEEASSLLRVNELNAPIITKAQTHFVVQNKQTKFIGLQVESSFFKITGDGVVGFNGGLDANLVLILSRDSMGKLPKEVAGSFVQQSDGSGSIAFHVTGTTSNPQTDLAQRLLLQNVQIKNVINKALNKFFH
jgi:hypothetical protein